MNTQENYYFKFSSELERQEAKNKIVKSPYYISHFFYEREAGAKVQFMLGLTLGNFVPGSSEVTGEHIPYGGP